VKTNETTKTILHFIPGDGPNGLIQAISLAPNLKIKILTLYAIDETVPKFCSENEIEIMSLGFVKKENLKQIIEFLKFLYRERPKIIFAHSFYPSLLCAVGRLFYWKAIFVPVRHHNQVHILSKNKKAMVLDQLISRLTSHTVGVSDAVKETLIQQGCKDEKISVIYNGLPKPLTRYSSKRRKDDDGPYKIVALGRIDWQKDYEVMLKIVSKLQHDGTELLLTILGGGNQEYLEKLKRLQGELGLLNNVSWLGRQPDIYRYLDEADLFIHTAIDEACPLVLIETLMYGIPIVSSNLGGCRDVLESFYRGCNPHDINEFSREISTVLENLDESNDYARQISEQAIEKFSPLRMQLEYAELSLKLLSRFKVC
jgi:glycosyltransferase involved in cell wall biosynthesis